MQGLEDYQDCLEAYQKGRKSAQDRKEKSLRRKPFAERYPGQAQRAPPPPPACRPRLARHGACDQPTERPAPGAYAAFEPSQVTKLQQDFQAQSNNIWAALPFGGVVEGLFSNRPGSSEADLRLRGGAQNI